MPCYTYASQGMCGLHILQVITNCDVRSRSFRQIICNQYFACSIGLKVCATQESAFPLISWVISILFSFFNCFGFPFLSSAFRRRLSGDYEKLAAKTKEAALRSWSVRQMLISSHFSSPIILQQCYACNLLFFLRLADHIMLLLNGIASGNSTGF